MIKPRFSKKLLVTFFCILAIAALAGFIFISQQKKFVRSLEKNISGIAEHQQGEFACVIKDMRFPYTQWDKNEKELFPAASLMKVPVLAVVFKAVDEGKLSLDEKVVVRRKDIAGGSGIIKAMKMPAAFSLRELLKIMIASSDNTATNKVISLLGYEYLNNGFTELGLKDTVLKRKMMDFSLRDKGVENYTSARDISSLLERMYRKELVDEAASGEMISYLKSQKINDRLPRYLPNEVTVAHKTGLERGVVHDAGIVFSPKGDYIICILTRGVNSYAQAKKFIADTSLVTYNLYQ
ncbi:MAG: serine hydrolase [Candidatus Omnitrophica bacterium]|nr:serine hydrolase [Candidatus Omnitrophota bacterium]